MGFRGPYSRGVSGGHYNRGVFRGPYSGGGLEGPYSQGVSGTHIDGGSIHGTFMFNSARMYHVCKNSQYIPVSVHSAVPL